MTLNEWEKIIPLAVSVLALLLSMFVVMDNRGIKKTQAVDKEIRDKEMYLAEIRGFQKHKEEFGEEYDEQRLSEIFEKVRDEIERLRKK